MSASRPTYNVAPNPINATNGGAAFLPGMMMMTASPAVPDDWLLCDGATVSRNTYPDLFEAIGTTFGEGDGLPVSFDTTTCIVTTPTILTITMTSGEFAPSSAFGVGKTFTMSGGPAGYSSYAFTIVARGTFGEFVDATAVSLGSPVIFAIGTYNTPGTITSNSPTTFQIPNTQAKTIRGVGSGQINVALGEEGGVDVIALAAANVPSHQHGVSNATAPLNHLPNYITELYPGSNTSFNVGNGGSNYATTLEMDTIFDANGVKVTSAGGSGEAFSIVNIFLGLNYIIKT